MNTSKTSDKIASVIKHYRYDLPDSADDTMHNIAADISDLLKELNPEFDTDRFMELCR